MGNELSQHLGVGESAVPDCCEARHEDQTVMHAVKAAKESSPTRSQTKQQPHGVGLVFQTGRDGKMVVSSFIRDSSAYESGLVKTGDVLCAVNGQDLANIPQEFLDRILLGERNTWVQMKFMRKTDAKQNKMYMSMDGSRGAELGKSAEDTVWASSKMRTMAPTYQQITVDLCRTTPSGILSEAVSQAEEEAKARSGRRGVKAR